MKKIIISIFLFFIFFNGFAQVADTIKIKAGKPYAFLISIPEYSIQVVGDNLEDEKNELKNNFKNQKLEVILIQKHCFLKFESGQGLDMTNTVNPYTSTAYWSGKVYDEIELLDRITNTTAFIAEKMGVDVKSTYVIKAIASNEEINKLLSSNNINKNSRVTLNKYLQMFHNAALTINEEFWLMQEIPKIKNIKIFFVENDKNKIYKNYEFNSLGQITYENEGKSNGWRKYIYENDMLKKIEKRDREILVNYDDNKMILSENIGDANETTVFWVENNILLSKRYILMKDNAYASQNTIIEEKIEANGVVNGIIKYSNGQIIEKNYSTPYGSFPYVHTYTSYQSAAANQKPEFMEQKRYKIEKKGTSVFEKYYSDAQKSNEKDNYKLNKTFYLNENNLIYKISSKKGILKIEYTFYP